MKAYRVTITIETYKSKKALKDENADPVRELRCYGVTTDYRKALKTASTALSKLDFDPLFGSDWES